MVERRLEIMSVVSPRNKITINPNTGRVTLKISTLAPDTEVAACMAIAEEVLRSTEFLDMTYRGKIRHVTAGKYAGTYLSILQNEKKNHSVHINDPFHNARNNV